ncbi:MAG: aspartate kinase [Candidatus Dormibacteria bacterium]
MSASGGPLRVMKFGGTSVGDPQRMAASASTIQEYAARGRWVVVVSALQRVTTALLSAAQAATRGETAAWRAVGEELRQRHTEVCDQLVAPAERAAVEAQLEAQLARFGEICLGFALLGETTPRALDSLASLGEVMSASLLAATLRARGLAAESVDATELIVTDDNHGNATLLFEPTNQRVRARLGPLLERPVIPVVTGFRAASREGHCTTLGRGGSDYSATILGATLPASEIWIWTDVAGMMTADPQQVPQAQVIPQLSYREAIELSFFGARILHPKALDLPLLAGIPVRIRNSFDPHAQGTEIGAAAPTPSAVTALAATSEASLFTVSGVRSIPFARLAAHVFAALDADGIRTLVVTQSSAENIISLVVGRPDAPRVRRRLERERVSLRGSTSIAAVEEVDEVGVVVAVGEGIQVVPSTAARILSAVADREIGIRTIAQGSSGLSISLVVDNARVSQAVAAMHQEFGLDRVPPPRLPLD